MKTIYLLILLTVPTLIFGQTVYKISYTFDSSLDVVNVREAEHSVIFFDGRSVFGGSNTMFDNDNNIKDFVKKPGANKEYEIDIDSLDVPDDLKEFLKETNNSNQMIIKRENHVETEETHSRFLIRNDTIYESRFGMSPNQKLVYPKPDFNWKITEKQKKIGEYTAHLATMTYYGRDFEAWFSYEVPIFTGPYIFGGLPGLILEFEDTQKHFQLRLKSIEKVDSMPEENISMQPVTLSLLDGIKLQHKAIDKVLLPLKMFDADNMIAETNELNQFRELILERIDYK